MKNTRQPTSLASETRKMLEVVKPGLAKLDKVMQPKVGNKKPMSIAMVSEHANPLASFGGADTGGQNVYVSALAKALAQQGVQVVIYTRRESPTQPKRVLMAPGVTVEHIDAGPLQRIPKDDLWPNIMQEFAAQLSQAWSQERPDVVHAHFWMSGWASLQAGRPLGIPIVQTFHALGSVKRRHQGKQDTSPPDRQKVEQEIIRNATRLVATCRDEVGELEKLGADRQRISVIPCGVELELFHPDGPLEERNPGLHRIVTVSRLVPRKGAGTVIEAMPYLPQAELIVAGGPAPADLDRDLEACRLRELAHKLGVAERVEIRGRILEREGIAALMRSADVFACVPWYEPFGIVPVEAMACGAPVVGSAVGGLLDTIVDGVTGFHVPPKDPKKLAEKIGYLLDNPALRQSMKVAAAKRAKSEYSWERIGRRMQEEVYQVLCVPEAVAV